MRILRWPQQEVLKFGLRDRSSRVDRRVKDFVILRVLEIDQRKSDTRVQLPSSHEGGKMMQIYMCADGPLLNIQWLIPPKEEIQSQGTGGMDCSIDLQKRDRKTLSRSSYTLDAEPQRLGNGYHLREHVCFSFVLYCRIRQIRKKIRIVVGDEPKTI
ncbi:unnamed protein product [Alternaria sp. RS040]